ncbi:glycosyltransferase [Desulfovibrio sp. JC010]|uniref:glycosyltransferase n=1 Tax=Desulfovibrio sp. JC010 TaxID=2593641 RepID=UPI0013D3689C|nr:glycosyltransferase [Desulfovibrio sp. JC010]NDV26323.1 glycosyltransferase [Desulfovibrio sp. JC010]
MLSRPLVHHTALGKSGGATRVGLMIHEGLLDAGHKSVHSFEASENPGDKLIQPEEAARAVPEKSIVHLHSSADPVRFLRALPASVKTVITLHDTQLVSGGCAYPLDCPSFNLQCRECPRSFPDSENVRRERIEAIIDSQTVLVSPSAWLGRIVRKAAPELKVKIIPNGIEWPEQPADKNQLRRELRIHPSSKVMLFVAHGGVEAAYKSGPQWKSYWQTIKSAVPEALCFAIGGKESSREGDFISIPYVDSPTLNKFLGAADVLAYPTLSDNHPLILLEAMAQSLAPVSYAVGGVVEQISDGENGILVPPYEKQIFTEKVSMLLKNSRLAREMGSRGFQKGKKRFSCQRMLGDYIKIYYNLV